MEAIIATGEVTIIVIDLFDQKKEIIIVTISSEHIRVSGVVYVTYKYSLCYVYQCVVYCTEQRPVL